MGNMWLDRLLTDIGTVYAAIPPEGVNEPWLMGATGDSARFLALDLKLMTAYGVLRAGNVTDESGHPWAAYWPTGESPDSLLADIRREYEAIPEDGHVAEDTYFGDLDARQLMIREALRDVNVISWVHVDDSGVDRVWVRGQRGNTNYGTDAG